MINNLYDKFKNWSCIDGEHKNSIYFISDPHFSDLDSYKYFRFPELFKVDQNANDVIKLLDKMQIDSINKVCTKRDCLVILGDVGNLECVKQLKAGYKVLILGNHDHGASKYIRHQHIKEVDCSKYREESHNDTWLTAMNFFKDDKEKQYDYVYEKDHEAYLKALKELKLQDNFSKMLESVTHRFHRPFCTWTAQFDNKLFDEVYEGSLQISPKIILSHEPVDSKFCLNIHGHCHRGPFNFYNQSEVIERHTGTEIIKYENTYYYYNCIAEGLNYKPISLKQIIESGCLKSIQDIHRATIDKATENKLIRGQSI